jgi:micrococcal nuclease
MKLDINTLGTFHDMAHEGAQAAADRLSKMTNVETQLDVTKVNFMSEEDIRAEFKEDAYYGDEATAQSERRGLWRCRSPGGTATPTADGPLRLVTLQADAPGDDHENLNGEYLVLENVANATLDLGSWTIADDGGHTYTVPDGFTLAPGERVTVYTGDGDDDATSLYWGADSAVWNNGGDTVVVRTANDTVVLERAYD